MNPTPPLDCAAVALLLVDLASDDLDDEMADAVDDHLASCPACVQLVDEYRAVQVMVHDALDLPLSDDDQAELDAMVLRAIARHG